MLYTILCIDLHQPSASAVFPPDHRALPLDASVLEESAQTLRFLGISASSSGRFRSLFPMRFAPPGTPVSP
jgi:hypothetical protein